MTWEEEVIEYMTGRGWKCDVNDENRLGFVFYENEEKEWIRDYDKKTKRFVQFNGRQVVNLRTVTGKDPTQVGTVESQAEGNEKD